MWFTKIQGRNPNTGQMIDEYSCAVAWIPTLLIENSQKERETGAAVESLRNHVASNGAAMLSLISGGALREGHSESARLSEHPHRSAQNALRSEGPLE